MSGCLGIIMRHLVLILWLLYGNVSGKGGKGKGRERKGLASKEARKQERLEV